MQTTLRGLVVGALLAVACGDRRSSAGAAHEVVPPPAPVKQLGRRDVTIAFGLWDSTLAGKQWGIQLSEFLDAPALSARCEITRGLRRDTLRLVLSPAAASVLDSIVLSVAPSLPALPDSGASGPVWRQLVDGLFSDKEHRVSPDPLILRWNAAMILAAMPQTPQTLRRPDSTGVAVLHACVAARDSASAAPPPDSTRN